MSHPHWGSLVFEGVTTEFSQNASSPVAEAEGDSIVEGLQAPAKSHPTRKQLRVFMQLLLRELLLAAPSPKQWLPLDMLLEVSAQRTALWEAQHLEGIVQGDLRADLWLIVKPLLGIALWREGVWTHRPWQSREERVNR